MNPPTVWIIKEQMVRSETGSSVMDYTPAMRFGELRFITRHDLPSHGRSLATVAWAEDVAEFARQYNQNRDFIVTTGQPMAIFMVGYFLAHAGKVPRFLAWRREMNAYVVVDCPVPQQFMIQ